MMIIWMHYVKLKIDLKIKLIIIFKINKYSKNGNKIDEKIKVGKL